MSKTVLVICNSHPAEYDELFIKLSGCDSTASSVIYSNSIIKGLYLNNVNHYILSAPSIGHYPFTSKTKKINPIDFGSNYYSVGYNNFALFSQHSKTKSLVRKFEEKVVVDRNEPLDIIVTDVHAPFIKAALQIKKRHKNSKIVVVCLDIPKYVHSSSKNAILKLFKKISVFQVNRLMKKVDAYVFLSNYMKGCFNSKNKKYIVSPCILDTSIYEGLKKDSAHDDVRVVYCGVLSKQYNVDLLLDAFNSINDNRFQLLLAGKGDLVPTIQEDVQKNKNIHYLGEINREKAYELQLNADVLVNPRLPKSEYTKISFPSKTISYLYSGNPLVCYSLPSFPGEIIDNIFEPKDLSPESFAEAIKNAVGQKKKEQIATALKYSEKNVVKQVIELFEEIRKDE